MTSLKYYFRYNSFVRNIVDDIFLIDYDIPNVYDNDRSAVMSSVDYAR